MVEIYSAVLSTCCSRVSMSKREMKLLEKHSLTFSCTLLRCTVDGSVKDVILLSRVPVTFAVYVITN
jgi:hypothetical protein